MQCKLNNNYQFRYPSKQIKDVYYPLSIKTPIHTYYSVPFTSIHISCQNVLIFYQNRYYIDGPSNKIPVQDVYHISKILNMPSVIVLNTYSDIESKLDQYDIYYVQAYKEMLQNQ